MEPQDTITIAPNVLITIVRHAAEQVEGIAGMGQIPVDVRRLLRGQTVGQGVVLNITGISVSVDLYLLVDPGTNMLEASRKVQQSVKRSVHELVGMEVTTVDVHIEDVDYSVEA